MSLAVVFSGQGAQHPDMLPWLPEDPIVQATCAHLRVTDWRSALSDPAWASCNANAQLMLTGLPLAAWHQLAPSLPTPTVMAGYSIGELAAFSAAGAFDANTALELARQRAAAMDRSAALMPGSLMSVSGSDGDVLDKACAAHGLDIAIRNGCHSLVVAGPSSALDRAEAELSAQGARCTRLRVSVRSHTPAMQQAAEDFSRVLLEIAFHRTRITLVGNATGERCGTIDQARQALAAQIATTVRWGECMEAIRARRPGCVLEMGPGHALARMWNDRYEDVPARSCDEFRSVAAVVRWVTEAAA